VPEENHLSEEHHQSSPKQSTRNLRGVLPFTRVRWKQLGLGLLSLGLFFTALELLKSGAREMTALTALLTSLDNPLNGLGLGWLSSYLTLSGSPVAAISLTLYDIQSINQFTTFSMIVGSRLGGSLIVIFIGLLYVIQGHERGTSLLTGVISFLVTAVVYIPAAPLGLLLLGRIRVNPELFDSWTSGNLSLIDHLFGPLTAFLLKYLPGWAVFGLGVGLTIYSLNLIDQALPEFELEENVFGEVPDLLYRPMISFLLGFVFTLLTMSVSISLGLLVPLSVRGYIKRENLLPYIMGCNVSTFIDTVIAGLLLRNAAAANLVVVQILSVLLVSLIILFFFYRQFQNIILDIALWLNARKIRLGGFLVVLILLPVLMILG
jgi:Na+/phosphate symporter